LQFVTPYVTALWLLYRKVANHQTRANLD